MYSWLQEAVAENAEIVTASQRLARELRAAYDKQQIHSGRQAWLTPPIRSWHNWLNRQLAGTGNPTTTPKRLDAFSSALLLEQCLRKQLPDGLPGVGGIVRQAVQSWQRLREWQVPLAELGSSAQSLDEQTFARAITEYAQRLDSEAWVDGAGIVDHVTALIMRKEISVPGKLVLAGFDRLNPSVQKISRALEDAGCTVIAAPARDIKPDISVFSYDTMDAELRAAGAWARIKLDDNPQARIAIVSPILETNAAAITHLIREGLVPGWQYGGPVFAAAINVSYGQKLADYPAIAIALLLLRWMHQGLSGRAISSLLRSPCVAGQQIEGRGRLELELRRHPDRAWSMEEFLQVFRQYDDSPDSVEFMDCVAELKKIGASHSASAGPAEWAKRIDAALTAARWPGDAALDSSEFQLVNRWRELLNEFARIEAVAHSLELTEVCQRLTALAADTLYQPESGEGLVRVLGMLEAAGMEFDFIWISGLDASQWPPVSRPALFISNNLQREYEMPDSTPGDTLEFARRVLDRLIASANNCVLSWATTRDDADLTASSLLDEYAGGDRKAAPDPGWYAGNGVGRAEIQLCSEDPAPPVTNEERVRGGAYTVQRQFVEPFGAFVYGRLGVRAPEPFATGLSPGVRGNIIHNALHNLLAGKPDRGAIEAWTAENRDQRIGTAIDSALAEHTLHADPIMRHLIRLERNRIRLLLHEFIATESGRPEFTVVDVERKLDYDTFGIRLGLRIDRIDRLANGQLLVIDYKTGIPKHFVGRSDAPADLQLIVYADALKVAIGGLLLINIDSRVISYKGAGGDGGPWKPRDENEWQVTLDSWISEVHKALQSIATGDVRINLKHSVSEGRPLNILSRKEEQKRVV